MGHAAEEIAAMIWKLQAQIKYIKKQPGEWWEKIDKIATLTVKEVEVGYEAWKGEDKKALAEGVILELYFKNFNIRWLPDFIERPAAKRLVHYVVDKAIDSIVAAFNRAGVFKHANSHP